MVWPLDQIYTFGSRLFYPFTFSQPVPSTSVQLSHIRALVMSRSRVPIGRIYAPAFASLARRDPAWTPEFAYRWLSFCYVQCRHRGDVGPVKNSPEWRMLEERGGRPQVVDEILFEDDDAELIWKPVVEVGVLLGDDVQKLLVELYYEGFADWFLEGIVEGIAQTGLWVTVEGVRECVFGAAGVGPNEWVFEAVEGLQEVWEKAQREEADKAVAAQREQEQRDLAAAEEEPMDFVVDVFSEVHNANILRKRTDVLKVLASRGWTPLRAWRWLTQMNNLSSGGTLFDLLERAERFPEDKTVVFDEDWIYWQTAGYPDRLRDVMGQLMRKGYDFRYLITFYRHFLAPGADKEERLLATLTGEDINTWLDEWVPGLLDLWKVEPLDEESAMNLRMVDANREFVKKWGLALRVFSQRGWPPSLSWDIVRALVEVHGGKKGAVIWAAEKVDPDKAWENLGIPRIRQYATTEGYGEGMFQMVVRRCNEGWSLEYLQMIFAWGWNHTPEGRREMLRTRLSQDPEEWLWSWAPGLEDIWTRAGYFDVSDIGSSVW